MAINFPSTSGQPTDGSYTHTVGNVTWSWDGSSWTASSNTGSGGGGGGIDLTNLSVTSNSVGTAALSYNNTSGVFTYTPPDLSGYALAAHSHTYALNDLSNVNVSAPITDGHILNWDNTNNEWVASGNINIDGNINLEGHIELGPVNATKISATDATLGHWNTVIENSTNGDIFIKGAELLLQANHTGVTKTWVHGNTDYSVDLYHDGDVSLSTSSSGIQVEANNTGIPGLQGEVNVGVSGNCKVLAFSDNGNNSAEDNNTFKIYSQHGTTNTTKTSILYESFYDQVWRVYGEGGSGCSGISHAELGRINHDGGWELRYHDIQGTSPNWTGTTCDKKLETTAGGVDVTGALDVSGKLTVTGIDNDGQYNIKPGGEFFKFENTSAWHLVYDHATLQQSHYAINVNKTYTRLYGGEPASADDWSLQATSSGVDVTGDLDVTGSITLNGSAITGGGGGGGATALDGLSDVNVSASILTGDILAWDTTNTEWVSSSNIDINGNITATGKVTTSGIDSNGQYNIKPGGEFFHFDNTSAWHLTFDKTGSSIGANWTYAIDASKTSVKLYGGEESGNDNNASVKLQTKTTGVDITGALDVTGSITLNGSAVNASGASDLIEEGNTSVETIDTGIDGTIKFETEGTDRWKITNGGHIIPYANAAYDIGNAEYKVRHLFLSDNSLWVGDDHKVSIEGGKMKFKKRKKSVVPASITAAGGNEAGALAHSGKASLDLISCFEWLAYLTSLDASKTDLSDLYPPEDSGGYTDEDYDEIINQHGPGKHPAPAVSGVAVLPIPLFTGNTFVLDQPTGDIALNVVGAAPIPGNNIDFKVYVMQGTTEQTIASMTIDGEVLNSNNIRVLGTIMSDVMQVFEVKCLHHNGVWNAIITAQ